jgi:hypothetical protein
MAFPTDVLHLELTHHPSPEGASQPEEIRQSLTSIERATHKMKL